MSTVVFDLETASADQLFTGNHSGPFCRLAGYAIDDQPVRTTTDMNELVRVLEQADVITGHNITLFDLLALARHHGADFPSLAAKAVDTLTAARLLDPMWPRTRGLTEDERKKLYTAARHSGLNGTDILTQSFTLNALCERYGIDAKTDSITRLKNLHGGYDAIPVDDPEYVAYLVGDVEASRKVFHAVRSELCKTGLLESFTREKNLDTVKGRLVLVGFRVDESAVRKALEAEEQRLVDAYDDLTRYGVPARREAGTELVAKQRLVKAKARTRYKRLFGKALPDGQKITVYRTRKTKAVLDPLSTTEGKQAVLQALLDAGVAPRDIPRTANSGDISLASDALGSGDWVDGSNRTEGLSKKYADNPAVLAVCQAVINVVSRDRKISELAAAIVEGRVHAMIGDQQASGRWAHVRPSITNLGKHGDKVKDRRYFLPEEGHVLLAVDLDQVDARVVAAVCQDAGLLAECEPGVDMHAEMGKRLFGEETYASDPKKYRKLAKGPRHGRNYGEGASKMAASMGLPVPEVQKLLDTMDAMYPAWCKWQADIRATAVRDGYQLHNGWRTIRVIPGMEHTQAPAQIGQSTTRELIVDGLLRMDEEILECLRVIVHDEVVLSVPADRVEEFARRVRQCFTTVFRGVNITAGAQQGINWADACNEDNEVPGDVLAPVEVTDGPVATPELAKGAVRKKTVRRGTPPAPRPAAPKTSEKAHRSDEEILAGLPPRHPQVALAARWWLDQGYGVRLQSGNRPVSKAIYDDRALSYRFTDKSLLWAFEKGIEPVTGYGVVCGPVEESAHGQVPLGLLGLDFDVVKEDGKTVRNGWAAWKMLLERHGIDFDSHTHITPSGGRHLIFRVPDAWWSWLVGVENNDLAITLKTGSVTGPLSMREDAVYAPDPEVNERLKASGGGGRLRTAPDALESVLREIIGERSKVGSYGDEMDPETVRDGYAALGFGLMHDGREKFRSTVLPWTAQALYKRFKDTEEGSGLTNAVFASAAHLASYAPHYADPQEVVDTVAEAALRARPSADVDVFLRSARRGVNRVWGRDGLSEGCTVSVWQYLEFSTPQEEREACRRVGASGDFPGREPGPTVTEAPAPVEEPVEEHAAPVVSPKPPVVSEPVQEKSAAIRVPDGVYDVRQHFRRILDRGRDRLGKVTSFAEISGQAWYLGRALAPYEHVTEGGVTPKMVLEFIAAYVPSKLTGDQKQELRESILRGWAEPLDYASAGR